MPRSLSLASLLTLVGLLLGGNAVYAQKELVKSDGWGSISGKVTYDGAIPTPPSLVAAMMKHNDKACCLADKATMLEKVDMKWLVDKNKGVANVIVWVVAPKGTYFPIHADYLKRKDHVVIDQPHCAFLPRVSVCNPRYFDGKQEVESGQKVIIKNSSVVSHNVRVTGTKNAFNKTLPANTEIEHLFEAEKLPVTVQCDLHTWMAARLLVLDHPYYAVTKADGTFTIPNVPAGVELSVIAWHEGPGYVSRPGATMVTVTNKGDKKLEFKTTQ